MMADEIICGICGYPMKDSEWIWGDEDAHKECVIKTAETICSKCGTYLDLLGCRDMCNECDAPMRPITEEDKEKLRKGA